jgi:hypothetical protein
MADQTAKTIHYFQAHQDYFWKWEDGGNVIEFANGRTICYREDLMFILNNLDLPNDAPVGSILLLLCACKDNYDKLFEFESHVYELRANENYSATEHTQAKKMIAQTLAFLKILNGLQYDLRSGLNRVALIQAILAGKPKAGQLPLALLLNEFESGSLDEVIFKAWLPYDFKCLYRDLAPLVSAFNEFPETVALELKLKTGLTQIPHKIEVPLPAPVPNDLMEELAADLKTAGLARLAKKISAALNIPMHLSGSSDQSIGGVSDISNRGHYDKLLLSELAQDDLLLTARLANNEALFLQREEMPANANQQWHILLDTTLKMWGMPRVFALAAGLAFSDQKKQGKMNTWVLGGQNTEIVELATRDGVITALEKLDPGLGCGKQLRKVVMEQASSKTKFILINAGQYKNDAAFLADFAWVKDQLDYLVEVTRDGHIALYETKGKRNKLVSQALIDLDETLFKADTVQRLKYDPTGLPAMMSALNYPLLFPASKIKIKNDVAYKFGDKVAILTQDQRVLCWTSKDKGGMELIAYVEKGECYWGHSDEYLFLLIRNTQASHIKIYQVGIVHQSVVAYTINDIKATEARYDKGLFHVLTENGIISVDPHNGSVIPGVIDIQQLKKLQVTAHFQVLNQIKKMINNGYSVINSAKSIYINANGRLFVDQRDVRLDPNGRYLTLKINEVNAMEWITPVNQAIIDVPHLPNLKFTKFSWADGSEAVVDSRGLLHLKSSDTGIPEITIILVVEKTTACWAADGKITGSPYFTGNTQKNVMLAADFYREYIERFINIIKAYATAA